jgi:hypothetical protein
MHRVPPNPNIKVDISNINFDISKKFAEGVLY